MSTNARRYYCTHLSWIDRADGHECVICGAPPRPPARLSDGTRLRIAKLVRNLAAWVGVLAFLTILGLVSSAINSL